MDTHKSAPLSQKTENMLSVARKIDGHISGLYSVMREIV